VLTTILTTVVGLGVVAGGSGAAAETRYGLGAVVTLGDSYISGEAGRWRGNSANPEGDRNGTDRAFTGSGYDPTLVYGATAANGCHRSDVAEVTHVPWLPARSKINLACSGAETINVLRTTSGGQPFKGEAPQNDQLALVAANQRVSAVVLSIGGNDLGFTDIVTACVVAFITNGAPCRTTQQGLIDQRLPVMREAVGRTIDDIRGTLAAVGYREGTYRIILQSYPIPLARAADMRYPQSPERQTVGGCPILDADADWDLAQQISDSLRTVANDRRVQFMDVRDAFRGHELCADAASQPDGTTPPREATSEWMRWIDLAGQGDLNESLHPTAFGQRALGRCLSLTLLLSRRDVSCTGIPGKSASWMYLRPLG
jgi:hypothetical protein